MCECVWRVSVWVFDWVRVCGWDGPDVTTLPQSRTGLGRLSLTRILAHSHTLAHSHFHAFSHTCTLTDTHSHSYILARTLTYLTSKSLVKHIPRWNSMTNSIKNNSCRDSSDTRNWCGYDDVCRNLAVEFEGLTNLPDVAQIRLIDALKDHVRQQKSEIRHGQQNFRNGLFVVWDINGRYSE